MRKHLLLASIVLFVSTSAFAINRIVNPFGGLYQDHPDAYWHEYPIGAELRDYYKFYCHCHNNNYKSGTVDKLLAEYNKLCQTYPGLKDAASCYLAYYYLRSDGILTSYQEGFCLLEEGLANLEKDDDLLAAKQSFLANMYDRYLRSDGILASIQEGFHLLEEELANLEKDDDLLATKQSFFANMYDLYFRPDGILASDQEGFHLLEEGFDNLEKIRATKQSFLANMYDLKAWALLTGRGVDQDFEQAFQYYQLAAALNDYSPEALVRVYYCTYFGLGTSVDYGLAGDLTDSILSFITDNVVVQCEDGRSLYYVLPYQFKQFIPVDIQNHYWSMLWSQEHGVGDDALAAYRKGMIDWLVNRDFAQAKEAFEEAIRLGHVPSMSELGMMYLDDAWDLKKDGETMFLSTLQAADEAGYTPANYIIGQRTLNHWGRKNPFSSSVEGEAYPYFQAAVKEGFSPAKDILALYDKGTYSTDTGMTAAIKDLNEGFNDGRPVEKSFIANLLTIAGAYASLGNAIAARNTANSGSETVGQPASASSSRSRTSVSSYSSSDEEENNASEELSPLTIHLHSEANKYYSRYEKHAQYWIDSFQEEHAWLSVNGGSKNAAVDRYELDSHQRSYLDAIKQLKFMLKEFQYNRKKSDYTIPKGEIEGEIEWCLAQDYPD